MSRAERRDVAFGRSRDPRLRNPLLAHPIVAPPQLHVLMLKDGADTIAIGGIYSSDELAQAAAGRAMDSLFAGYNIHPVPVDVDLFLETRVNNFQPKET